MKIFNIHLSMTELKFWLDGRGFIHPMNNIFGWPCPICGKRRKRDGGDLITGGGKDCIGREWISLAPVCMECSAVADERNRRSPLWEKNHDLINTRAQVKAGRI